MCPTPVDSSLPVLTPGSTMRGKWNGTVYQIGKRLGAGANGSVYVAERDRVPVALKLSFQAPDLALEYGVLNDWQKSGPAFFAGPHVFELDDTQIGSARAFYYAMEYVRGRPINDFIQRKGLDWVGPLSLQILASLDAVHSTGHAFGDLKADNILVQNRDGRVRLIDFGGMTPFGRGVRQFTKWYDRAWWGRGERKADAAYDLFAFAQLICALSAPEVERRIGDSDKGGPTLWLEVVRLVERDRRLALWRPLIEGIWGGRFTSALAVRDEVKRIVTKSPSLRPNMKRNGQPKAFSSSAVHPSKSSQRGRRMVSGGHQTSAQMATGKPARKVDWTTWFLVVSAAAMCGVSALAWHFWD